MGRCCGCKGSAAVLAILNLLTLFISLAMVVTGLMLAAQPGTACQRFLDTPLFLSGAFLLVVSFLGLAGACCRVPCMLWLYLIFTFLLIVALTCFTAAAFVVTNRTAGRAAAGQGYGEYRLGDYSHWLQKVVNDENNWVNIESCLKEAKVCGGPPPPTVAPLLLHTSDFYKTRLNSIRSGCCRPPPACGLTALNTSSSPPAASGLVDGSDDDCKGWTRDEFCFSCKTCKAGVLENVRSEWQTLALFNVGLLVFLVFVYSVGSCAARSSSRDRYRRYTAVYRA